MSIPPTLFVITVIPLTRSKISGELSYFTNADVPLGAIVSVPLRSRNIHAIVTSTRPAVDMKAEIRGASFQMKKLGKVRSTAFFPATFMEACGTLSDYYAASVGSIIDALVSDTLLENANKIDLPIRQNPFFNELKASGTDETYAVQGDDEDRLGSWRSLIRQEFARKRSVAIYVPTIEDTAWLTTALTKGIEGYIFTLHSSLTKKQIIETWRRIAETAHPVVVVATGSFTVIPRADIDCVVIERENGRGWISARHPYLDIRHAIETIARRQKQTVYRADSVLRIETLHRVDVHEIAQGSPFKWRSISNAQDVLVDMKRSVSRTERPSTEELTQEEISSTLPAPIPFHVLSPELKELIAYNRHNNTHLFILAMRRGHSPITVCGDCETIVSCRSCSSPVVLHTREHSGRAFFMCHRCGERRDAHEKCQTCDGWRLTPLGIGIDRVHEVLRAEFPDLDIFKIDADSVKTETQLRTIMSTFRSKPGSVLIGTEMALLHVNEGVDHVAIASLDSLFALPDFRINERIMYLMTRLRSIAQRSFVVQTRRADERIFEYSMKGNVSDFYRTTLAERKQFHYPPYATLIKITIEGKKDRIAEAMAQVQKTLAPHEIDIFPAFTSTVRGNAVIHGLIKLSEGGWPHSDLLEKIRSLSPDVKVKVDPESLL